MSRSRIQRRDDGGLCTLTLDRADKLNALDTLAFDELDGHLAALEQQTDVIGCVVLRAEGRGFCAGADLSAMGVRADGTAVDSRFKPGVIERLGRLPQPTIAAIHGVCFTGGLELALACDFLIADRSARFADTHGKWGLVGAWGIMQRLPRRIGVPAAQMMSMTAREVSAERALELRLIDLLADDLGNAADGLASDILANSWHTNFVAKRTMRETEGMSLAAALAHDNYRNPGNAPDHAERIARFSKK